MENEKNYEQILAYCRSYNCEYVTFFTEKNGSLVDVAINICNKYNLKVPYEMYAL